MKWWTSVVILVTAISLASARGGRGGGGRFSSRGRYSSSSTRSYRSSFSGNRLSSSSSIRSALLLGTVYGASRYRQRARFIKDGTLPEICYNDSYNMSTNGTISYQGRFFCPIDENMSEDYRYCCGEEGQQYCCRFWDSPGRVVGVVVGILFGVVAMFVLVFCVIKHFKRERRKPQNNTYTDQTATFNDHAMYPPAYAPPTYEMSNTNGNEKKPYPPNDTGYYSNYGFTPTVFDPQTAPPYPTTTTSNPTANDTYGQKY